MARTRHSKVVPGRQMIVGIFLYDDSERSNADKVNEAARRYVAQFGRWPNVCYVHESDVPTGETQGETQIAVVVTDTLLPNHFWVGVR